MASVKLEEDITGEYILPKCMSIEGIALRRNKDGWVKETVRIEGPALLRAWEYEHQDRTYWRVQARRAEQREEGESIQIQAEDWQTAVRPCGCKQEAER